MVYQSVLDGLCRAVTGAQGALMLDAGGEVVVAAGKADDQLRLIGAYQGIALTIAQRAATRYAAGSIDCLVCRYEGGTVILRPLKDGYFLVLWLAVEANVAVAVHQSQLAHGHILADM
jgi:predicted regulator of Ras-like GTPase activity (Roadblock/LC7/MglB family)